MKANTKILLALAAGALAGTALTLLLAPQKGADFRKGFKEKSKKFSADVKDLFEDMKVKMNKAREDFKKTEPVS